MEENSLIQFKTIDGLLLRDMAMAGAALLEKNGMHAAVINASSLRPLDDAMLKELTQTGTTMITVEEHALSGGFGHAVAASRKTTYLFEPKDDASPVQLYRENVH